MKIQCFATLSLFPQLKHMCNLFVVMCLYQQGSITFINTPSLPLFISRDISYLCSFIHHSLLPSFSSFPMASLTLIQTHFEISSHNSRIPSKTKPNLNSKISKHYQTSFDLDQHVKASCSYVWGLKRTYNIMGLKASLYPWSIREFLFQTQWHQHAKTQPQTKYQTTNFQKPF